MGVCAKNSGLVWVVRHARAKPGAPRQLAHLQPKPVAFCLRPILDLLNAPPLEKRLLTFQ